MSCGGGGGGSGNTGVSSPSPNAGGGGGGGGAGGVGGCGFCGSVTTGAGGSIEISVLAPSRPAPASTPSGRGPRTLVTGGCALRGRMTALPGVGRFVPIVHLCLLPALDVLVARQINEHSASRIIWQLTELQLRKYLCSIVGDEVRTYLQPPPPSSRPRRDRQTGRTERRS